MVVLTGNLTAKEGHAYGFELTFFRVGVNRKRERDGRSDWAVNDIYMAHLALSDEIAGGHFYHRERLNRTGAGIAGVEVRIGKDLERKLEGAN